jgi:hypothetical protein
MEKIIDKKRGSAQWTVGKLLTIVLLIIFLVLVVYGISTGGFRPIIERIGGMFDNVMILIYRITGTGGGGNTGECYYTTASIGGVGSGMLTLCKDKCSFSLGEGIVLGGVSYKNFAVEGGKLFYNDNIRFTHSVTDIKEIEKNREAYRILKNDFDEYVLEGQNKNLNFFKDEFIYIKVGSSIYIRWINGKWQQWDKKTWENTNWDDDDAFKNIIEYRRRWIRGNLPIYHGITLKHIRMDAPDYNSPLDFDYVRIDLEFLQNVLKSKNTRIANREQEISILRSFLGQISKDRVEVGLGQFQGQNYGLFLKMDSDNSLIFYFYTYTEEYGIKIGKNDELILYKVEGNNMIRKDSTYLKMSDTDWENIKKLNNIYNYLRGMRC